MKYVVCDTQYSYALVFPQDLDVLSQMSDVQIIEIRYFFVLEFALIRTPLTEFGLFTLSSSVLAYSSSSVRFVLSPGFFQLFCTWVDGQLRLGIVDTTDPKFSDTVSMGRGNKNTVCAASLFCKSRMCILTALL